MRTVGKITARVAATAELRSDDLVPRSDAAQRSRNEHRKLRGQRDGGAAAKKCKRLHRAKIFTVGGPLPGFCCSSNLYVQMYGILYPGISSMSCRYLTVTYKYCFSLDQLEASI